MRHMKRSDLEKLDRAKSAPDEVARPGRRDAARLEIPSGELDLEGLRSVTREWLVPVLVEKFLSEHGIEPRRGRTRVRKENQFRTIK